ncbi:MAG TPA: hypothetical protein VN732_08525, partial [Solirubrobacterales bacterium]|nr:hypothetical protein [Solirubrobacterales bacterium]
MDTVELFPLAEDALEGFRLEGPTPGATSNNQALYLDGWILGRKSPVRAVEVLQEGRSVLRIPVDTPRKDLAAAFPDAPGAATGGFSAAVGALRLRTGFELLLRG